MADITGKNKGYFHFGKYEINFGKIYLFNTNPFLTFLSAIIMNILEQKHCTYYVSKNNKTIE